jgi:F-type H+-transporting ATPase subunit b
MDATAWATFWAAVSFFLLIAVFIYLKVPAMAARSLDERADRIKQELEEARQLREDAQQLLAEYQRKRQEAEKEAGDIVAAAQREAGLIVEEAKEKTEEYVTRRTALAEQKIGQAEKEAVSEVRARAVDVAVEAARRVLSDKVDAKAGGQLFRASLEAVRTRMN